MIKIDLFLIFKFFNMFLIFSKFFEGIEHT